MFEIEVQIIQESGRYVVKISSVLCVTSYEPLLNTEGRIGNMEKAVHVL